MIHTVLFAGWFLLPAALANVVPVISNKLPGLKHWHTPLDFDKTWRGKRIFGAHKTWRGLASGIVVAALTFALQQYAVRHTTWAAGIVNHTAYAQLPILLLGALFGIGALGGDAVESFFKRRRDIASGHSWLLFDQTDYVVGGILVSLPFIILPLAYYLTMLIFWLIIHLLGSYVGYKIGLKERPI